LASARQTGNDGVQQPVHDCVDDQELLLAECEFATDNVVARTILAGRIHPRDRAVRGVAQARREVAGMTAVWVALSGMP